MRGYSLDLRERVVKAAEDEKQSVKEAVKRFGLSHWTVNRYLKRNKEGKLAATKPPSRSKSLDKDALDLLDGQVKEHKDWTLEQHANALNKVKGVSLKKSSIGNYLRLLGTPT